MRWHPQNLTGQIFERLTVLEKAGKDKHNHILWDCLCVCGNTKSVRTGDLNSGQVKSCGCLNHNSGEFSKSWKGGKVEAECSNPSCDNLISKYKSQLDLYDLNYCSNECRHSHYSQRIQGKNNPRYKDKIKSLCSYCGTIIEFWPCKDSSYDKHFCNRECLGKWKSINNTTHNNPNWKGGKSFEPYPITWNFKLREMIRDRDGRKCQICGAEENGERLAVHHVDYSKRNIDPENLMALCHNCHCKTNSDRDQWINFFNFIKYFNQPLLLTGTDN
jgi:5-methylcytosine-specific restriction endonuclease McrA